MSNNKGKQPVHDPEPADAASIDAAREQLESMAIDGGSSSGSHPDGKSSGPANPKPKGGRKRKRGSRGKRGRKGNDPAAKSGDNKDRKGDDKPPAKSVKTTRNKVPIQDEYIEIASQVQAEEQHWMAFQPRKTPGHCPNPRFWRKEGSTPYPVVQAAFTYGPPAALVGYIGDGTSRPVNTRAYLTVNAAPKPWLDSLAMSTGSARVNVAQKQQEAPWKHPYSSFLRGVQLYAMMLRFFNLAVRHRDSQEPFVLFIVLSSGTLATRIENCFYRMREDVRTALVEHGAVPSMELHFGVAPIAVGAVFPQSHCHSYNFRDTYDVEANFSPTHNITLILQGHWMIGHDWDLVMARSDRVYALGGYYPGMKGEVRVPHTDKPCFTWVKWIEKGVHKSEYVAVVTDDGHKYTHRHDWWNATTGEGEWVYRATTVRNLSYDFRCPSCVLLNYSKHKPVKSDTRVRRIIRQKAAGGSTWSSLMSSIFALTDLDPNGAADEVKTSTKGLYWATTAVRFHLFLQRDIANYVTFKNFFRLLKTLSVLGVGLGGASVAMVLSIVYFSRARRMATRLAQAAAVILGASMAVKGAVGGAPSPWSAITGFFSSCRAMVAGGLGAAPERIRSLIKVLTNRRLAAPVFAKTNHAPARLSQDDVLVRQGMAVRLDRTPTLAECWAVTRMVVVCPMVEETCKHVLPPWASLVYGIVEHFWQKRAGVPLRRSDLIVRPLVHYTWARLPMKYALFSHCLTNLASIGVNSCLVTVRQGSPQTFEDACLAGDSRECVVSSVCGYPNAKVREGVTVKENGLRLCTSSGHVATEEILSLLEVLAWRCHTCPVTSYAAATSRMGGPLKVPSPDPNSVEHAMQIFFLLLEAHFSRDIKEVHTAADYIEELTGKKAALYKKAFETWVGMLLKHYTMFVKNNEKNMTPRFCNCEKHVLQRDPANYAGNSPVIYNGFDPRGISVPDMADRLACGANVRTAMSFLKLLDEHVSPLLYAAGKDAETLSNLFMERAARLEVGQFFELVLGDDVSFVCRAESGLYNVEIDTSRQDMHTSLPLIQVLYEYLVLVERLWGVDLGNAKDYTSCRIDHGKPTVYRKGWLYRMKMHVDDTTASGDPTTALAAALATFICTIWSIKVGTTFEEGFAQLGYHAKVKWILIAEDADWAKPTFLQRHFMPTREGGPLLTPAPGRAASKQFVALRPEVPVKKTVDWLRGNALGLLQDAGQCPITSALGRRALALAGGGVGDVFFTENERRKEENRMHCMTKHKPGKTANAYLRARYGVSDKEVEAIVSEISEARWGSRLSHPAWRKIVAVDVCGEVEGVAEPPSLDFLIPYLSKVICPDVGSG